MSEMRLSIIGDCTIHFEKKAVTPAAPHVFALLLLLASDSRSSLSRQDLQRMLFPADSSSRHASHSLRQLLYRLKQLGVSWLDGPTGIALGPTLVVGALEGLLAHTPAERAELPPRHFVALPSYEPRLTPAFADWLDEVRTALSTQVRSLLLADVDALRAQHDWHHLASLCSTLLTLDPANVDAVSALAEALSMTGRQRDALDALDVFTSELATDDSVLTVLKRLRSRITKRSSRLHVAPFRGRSSTLSQLTSEWEKAQSGGARLACLTGVAGIGKSRLLDELGATIGLSGGTVIHHRCDSQSQGYPLALVSSILPSLRAMRGSIGADPRYRSLLDQLIPSLSDYVRCIPESVSAEAIRAELQAAIADLFEAVSSEQSILLTIDDAHHLDDSSCALLQHISYGHNCSSLLVVTASRPRDFALSRVVPGQRVTTTALPPLDDASSQALFLDIAGERRFSALQISSCLSEARGNPFYLKALAQEPPSSSTDSRLPFDIHSLAHGAYFSLTPSERLVLDACLLLGEFASIERISRITDLDRGRLAAALRRLEDSDLIHLIRNTVRGPHALLQDALRALIPSTVAALLQAQIARALEAECTVSSQPVPLALAAAESWIAAGDIRAAVGLTLRCAAEAAALGEPSAAADMLNRVSRVELPRDIRRQLLDALIGFGEAGSAHELVASALRERMALAVELEEKEVDVRSLELKIIENDLLNGAETLSAVKPLKSLLERSRGDVALLCKSAAALLVIADAEYDRVLASWAYSALPEIVPDDCDFEADALRAKLVFHTTFGSLHVADTLASKIEHRFPEASVSDACRRARRYAAFSYFRQLNRVAAKRILECDYRFMADRSIRSEALYAASLLTEIAITEGDFGAASRWFAEGELQLRGAQAHRFAPNSGYHSSAAVLLMMQGRYDEAESHIPQPQGEYSRMRTARYEALCLALRLRLYWQRGDGADHTSLINQLESLYTKGCELGHQDTVVELLWVARVLQGRSEDASSLLSDYLLIHRRERSVAEWSLRNTTAADPTWLISEPLTLR